MRAATVIVGAIAVSSCLIALALVLTSDSGGSSQAPARSAVNRKQTKGSTPNESAGASGPVQCNVEVTVEGASCLLGKSVLTAFKEKGSGAGVVTAVDPQSGGGVSFECTGTAPTICTAGGVTVYLPPAEP